MEQHQGRETTRLRLITIEQVMVMTGLGKSHIYDLVARQLFPRPVRVGLRAVRWWEHEVIGWMRSRPRATLDNLR